MTIIGARRCTAYAKEVVSEAATFLAVHGGAVISGLSKGVEGYAHTACLNAGGHTLAFLGHGLDSCYPTEHRELMETISLEDAIISQFPLGSAPHPANFLKRNYLMAAWSPKMLVVEGGLRSAALQTAQHARELGRLLFAVPHNIYSKEGKGTNNLLKKGARIYLDPSQLLALEREVLKILGDSSVGVEHLVQKLNREKTDILEIISTLHIDGKLTILPIKTEVEPKGVRKAVGFNRYPAVTTGFNLIRLKLAQPVAQLVLR